MEQAVERNYLMVRAMDSSENDFNVFFKNYVVAVGWSEVNFADFDLSRTEQLVEEVREQYYSDDNILQQVLGRKLNYIRRFHNIRKGDFIIVPYYDSIRLAEATGGSIYSTTDKIFDLANQQKVEFRMKNGLFKTIPRDELSEALQRRLRVRGSIVSDLYEFKDEIERLFSNTESYSWSSVLEQKEFTSKQTFKNTLKERICSGNTNLRTGGIGLENLVKDLFSCEGYQAEVLPKNKKLAGVDSDVDISAVKPDKFQIIKIFAQVKHHSGYSGDWGISQLKSVKEHESYIDYKFIFITSGEVDTNVTKTADDNDIDVIDGNKLVEWIFENLSKLSSDTKNRLGISSVPQLIEM